MWVELANWAALRGTSAKIIWQPVVVDFLKGISKLTLGLSLHHVSSSVQERIVVVIVAVAVVAAARGRARTINVGGLGVIE